MQVIIDRFEGDFAVVELEDRSHVNMVKKLVPIGATEGTILTINIDRETTDQRKAEIARLASDLYRQ